jgi:hypothetical protein
MDVISDMQNYIQSRKRKGKTFQQTRDDLIAHGYDQHAAHGLTMMHWYIDCENPECLEAGRCDGECARNFDKPREE